MYEIQLTDALGSDILPPLDVPLTMVPVEGTVDVTTLSNDLYTDFMPNKRVWSHTWSYLTPEEYELVYGYYSRQFTLFEYPVLDILRDNVQGLYVRMTLSGKNIIDECGVVQNVTVSFRETRQLGS